MLDFCRFCPIQATVVQFRSGGDASSALRCPNCGLYTCSRTRELEPDQKAIISRHIFKNQQGDKPCEINDDDLDQILTNTRMPSYAEQLDEIVLYVGDDTKYPSQKMDRLLLDHVCARFGCFSARHLDALVTHLINDKLLLKGEPQWYDEPDKSRLDYGRLTAAGWERYDSLRGRGAPRRGFMAMDFEDDDVAKAYAKCFTKAAERVGFHLKRVDESHATGNINANMEVAIRNAMFVVADLSGNNLGVYWEAGYAEGLDRPVFYTCEEGHFHHEDKKERPHFDTNHHVTTLWSEKGLKKAEDELVARFRVKFPDLAIMED